MIDEARMRRALGLDQASAAPAAPSLQQQPAQQRPEPTHPGQARVRHRFVQDGEVPVEVVNARGTTERAERASGAAMGGNASALQAELRAEQQARAGAERSLAEARAVLQALHTQLAHAELAHAEALATERRAREAAEAAITDREAAELRQHEAVFTAAPRLPIEAKAAPKRPRAAKPARQAAAKRAREPAPKPVKWWLPDYRAKAGED